MTNRAARLKNATKSVIAHRIKMPMTEEEAAWVDGMREFSATTDALFNGPTWNEETDVEPCRELFWELKLGVADWVGSQPQESEFVSHEAYQQFLAIYENQAHAPGSEYVPGPDSHLL